MEDRRENLAVIIAGYDREMRRFVNSNSGLRSRFQRFIAFPDFTPDELLTICERTAEKARIEVPEGVRERLRQLLSSSTLEATRGKRALGRNLFETMYARMAARADADGVIEPHEILAFESGDVPETMSESGFPRPAPGYL